MLNRLVDTALGAPFAKATGFPSISVDESVKGYLQQVSHAFYIVAWATLTQTS